MNGKHIQRYLSLLIALIMVLSLAPFTVSAEETEGPAEGEHEIETVESAPAEAEKVPDESSDVIASITTEEIQARINTILNTFGITTGLTDNEIADAIIAADSDTSKAAMDEMAAIEADARSLSEEDLQTLDTELYSRFCNIVELLFYPVPITERTPLAGQVTVSDSANSSSISGTTVTITAKGGLLSKKTNTVTIKNISDKKATISFAYSASTYNSFTIAGAAATSASGTYSNTLEAGGTVTFVIQSNSGLFNTTATLTLSDFSYQAAVEDAEIAFTFDSAKGSVKVGGESITSGTAKAVTSTGIAVEAIPNNGITFLGWIDVDSGMLISANKSHSLVPTEGMTGVQAVFVTTASDTAWFLASRTHLFNNLTNAVNFAASASTKVVVLANNGTLPAGDYTITSGVTLLIPHDETGTVVTTNPPVITSPQSVSVYRTLTMNSGAKITVKGTVSIAASLAASQTTGHNGLPTGKVAQINMNQGSSITVENSAFIYAIGHIYGSGCVEVKSGGTVYECFQLRDFRGGTATSGMMDKSAEYRLFPLMQYYMQNIQVPMTLNSGALEYGLCSFDLTLVGPTVTVIPFIGANGMFNISNGYVIKDYGEGEDRLIIKAYGDLEINSYEFPLAVGMYTAKIKTIDYFLPVNHNITVDVLTGTLSINQDLSLLPGAQIIIREGVTCTLGTGTEIIVYDHENWDTYCGEKLTNEIKNVEIKPLLYVAGNTIVNRTWENTGNASVQVDGTVDASNGYIYTTTNGASIFSTGSGKIINLQGGSINTAYQAMQEGSTITYISIPITPAKLKHGDGTYLQSEANTYTYRNDRWVCKSHSYADGVCTVCGTTLSICNSNIAATDSLNMFFYLEKEKLTSDDYYAVVTKKFADGRDDSVANIPYSEWKSYDDTLIRFGFDDISAKEMMDQIQVVVYNADGTAASALHETSIRKYATDAITAFSNKAELVTALTDMLNYGAAAQTYFGYNTDNLANTGIDQNNASAAAAECEDKHDKGKNYYGTTVSARNQMILTFYFTNITDSMTAYVSYKDHYGNDETLTVEGKDFYARGNLYGVDVTGLAVADGRQLVTCVVKNGDMEEARGVDSIESFVARSAKNEVFEMLMRFVDSAHAYFH